MISDVPFSASRDLPLATQDEWISVLRVAHRFGFTSMRMFAIKHLSSLTSSVDRIVLAHEFGIEEWLKPAYSEVCMSPDLVSDADIRRLGFELFMKIARMRDGLKAFTPFAENDVMAIVEAVFRPEPAQVASAPAPVAIDELGTTDDWFPSLIKKKANKKKKGIVHRESEPAAEPAA
jgi:hypothetical protein